MKAPAIYCTVMPMLDIYTLGDEVLREKCKEITKFDSALRMLADAMIETMDEADGVGLAGPQVGVPEKIFVIHIGDDDPMVFINPEIIETSIEECPYEEGCLSIPGVYHDVIRPARVTVQAQDLDGKSFTVKADGLLARAIQHENDHLSGVLYIDHLTEGEQKSVIKSYERKNKARLKARKRGV